MVDVVRDRDVVVGKTEGKEVVEVVVTWDRQNDPASSTSQRGGEEGLVILDVLEHLEHRYRVEGTSATLQRCASQVDDFQSFLGGGR